MIANQTARRPGSCRNSFADGTLPLSTEAIQAEILRYNRTEDGELYRALQRAQFELDQLTLQMCEEERARGNRIPDWLLQAELDAFMRQRRRDTQGRP